MSKTSRSTYASASQRALKVTCLFCKRTGFSKIGLRQHWCKTKGDGKKTSAKLSRAEWQLCVDSANGHPAPALIETPLPAPAAAEPQLPSIEECLVNMKNSMNQLLDTVQPRLEGSQPKNENRIHMKLTIARSHLAAALATVRNTALASPDATHPVLANVLLAADGKMLTLTTTDLAVSLRTQMAADVNLKGAITVRAALLHDLVKSFLRPDKVAPVLLSLEPGQEPGPGGTSSTSPTLKVISGDASFELATLEATEFPAVTTPADAQVFELLEHELAALLRRTTFARGTDEKRLLLTGTLIRMDGATFVAACDGLRLAVEQGADTTLKADLNLPAKAVGELIRLLATDAEKPRKVTVTFNSAQAQFAFGEHLLITRLIEGEYPDYTKIVPTLEDARIVTVNRPALLAAIKRVALISDGVELDFKPKRLNLRSHGEAAGKSSEILPTEGTVDIAAKYAAKLLIEALEAITAEEVNLYPPVAEGKPIAIHDPTATWLGVVAAMKA